MHAPSVFLYGSSTLSGSVSQRVLSGPPRVFQVYPFTGCYQVGAAQHWRQVARYVHNGRAVQVGWTAAPHARRVVGNAGRAVAQGEFRLGQRLRLLLDFLVATGEAALQGIATPSLLPARPG